MQDKAGRLLAWAQRRARWCTPCIIAGIALFAYGSVALAQVGMVPTPDYTLWLSVAAGIISLLAGLVVSMIGAFVKGMNERVGDNKRSIERTNDLFLALQRRVDTEHHTKEEANAQFAEVKAAINAVHRRLDVMHVPSAFPKD